jgi:hypothetical protein
MASAFVPSSSAESPPVIGAGSQSQEQSPLTLPSAHHAG